MKRSSPFIFLFLSFILLGALLVGAIEFVDNNQGDFNNGTFFRTFFNTSTSSIELNISGSFTFGNYTSQIFDATSPVGWDNISWCGVGNDGAPEGIPLSCEGSLNMSDNRLLMHLDEASGLILDTSGNNNNGTYNGVLFDQAGKIATSIGFDGTNDFINVSDEALFDFERTDAFSVAFWANINDDSSDHFIVAKEGSFGGPFFGWSIFSSNGRGDSLNFELFGQSADTNRSVIFGDIDIVDGEWHHLAVVKEAGTGLAAEMSVYVDGVKDTTNILDNDLGTTSILNDFPLTIGSRDGGGIPVDGEIDEVIVFARNISAAQVAQLYRRGVVELNLSVRTCNDENCSGETFTDLGDVSTPVNLALIDNRFFQYKYDFSTSNVNFTPQINNVTVNSGIPTPFPAIFNESASQVTSATANISWTTDELSNSSVNFGITEALGTFTSIDDLVRDHSIILTDLSASTVYFFNVSSSTITGQNTTGPFNFSTGLTVSINKTERPESPTTFRDNQTYEFFVTIASNVSLDTIFIEFEGVNFTPTLVSGETFRFTRNNLQPATYSFRWMGNTTGGRFAITETFQYRVINENVNVTYFGGLILAFVLLALGYGLRRPIFIVLSGSAFIILGITIVKEGVANMTTPFLAETTAIISVGLGIYLLLVAGLDKTFDRQREEFERDEFEDE